MKAPTAMPWIFVLSLGYLLNGIQGAALGACILSGLRILFWVFIS
jgi:hypothetical protein